MKRTVAKAIRPRKAFVLRIAPGKVSQLASALQDNEVFLGWSDATGLSDLSLDWLKFREVVHRAVYPKEKDRRKSGSAAGQLWLFIRDMEVGDLVVIPTPKEFHVARIAGPYRYDETRYKDDTAHRRPVEWLNDREAIPRSQARSALQARMKVHQSLVDASHLIPEIDDVLSASDGGVTHSFEDDLQQLLMKKTLEEIQTGRLEDYGFEKLVGSLLKRLGAEPVEIVARTKDRGADILATFQIAEAFPIVLAVQAKHYRPDPPIGASVVEELVRGMEAAGTDYGWIVTSGTFSKEAVGFAKNAEERKGLNILLVDGEQLAKMILENGVTEVSSA